MKWAGHAVPEGMKNTYKMSVKKFKQDITTGGMIILKCISQK
jgi:hypothetical protein